MKLDHKSDQMIHVSKRNKEISKLIEAMGKSSDPLEQMRIVQEISNLRSLPITGDGPVSTPYFLPLDEQGDPIHWRDIEQTTVDKFLVHDPFHPELIPVTYVVPKSDDVIGAIRRMTLFGRR